MAERAEGKPGSEKRFVQRQEKNQEKGLKGIIEDSGEREWKKTSRSTPAGPLES